jgi:hypothetical protein
MAGFEKYKSSLAFVDLLFNILLGVFILYWLAQLLINEPESKQVDTVAQVLVTLDWPDESGNDIDIWVRDPSGLAVGYQNRDAGVMSLERDDLGHVGDSVLLHGKPVILKMNHEVITLRGLVPGEYQVSVHYYRGSAGKETPPTPITVKLIKVNPKYNLAFIKEALIIKQGDELPIFQFTIETQDGINGKIIEVNEEEKHFVIKQQFAGQGSQSHMGGPQGR